MNNNKKIEEMDKEVEEAKKFANEFFKKLKNINDKDFDNDIYVGKALDKFPLFATDEAGRNILHYAFMRGKYDALATQIRIKTYFKKLRNQRDLLGLTPMEYGDGVFANILNDRKDERIMWFLFRKFYSDEVLNENDWLKHDMINDFYRNGDSERKDSVVRFCRTEGLLSEKECFKKFGTEATIKSYTYGELLTKQDVIRIREAYKEYIVEKYQGQPLGGLASDPNYAKQVVEFENKNFYESIEKVLCEQKRMRQKAMDNPYLQEEARINEEIKVRETLVKQAFAAGDSKFDKFLDDYKI